MERSGNMKVVGISNFSNEALAERLVKDNLTEIEARQLAAAENVSRGQGDRYYYVIKDDDYVLWRGMGDLIV